VQLLSKAAATTSMIVWNDALAYSVTAGIGEEQPEVKQRTLLLYSLTMTFAGRRLDAAPAPRSTRD